MLEVNNVSLGYGNNVVVKGVSLQLATGEIGCLLGASGCGKTTLLRAIGGFEPLRSGDIVLQAKTVATASSNTAPQHRDIGMVFQDHALFPHLSVGDNVGFGLNKLSKAQRQGRVADMLALVGLQGMEKRWPHELSGGQQQRVALARALAPQPSLLLMDEPFSSLDTSLREAIAREVRDILKRAKATALMVTHDQNEAFAMADNIGVMAAGHLMQWGSAPHVYGQPATREVALFVGEGALLNASRTPEGFATTLGQLPAHHPHYGNASGSTDTSTTGLQVLLRPEQVGLTPSGTPAQVTGRIYRGSHFLYELQLSDGQRALAHAGLGQLHEVGARVGAALIAGSSFST